MEMLCANGICARGGVSLVVQYTRREAFDYEGAKIEVQCIVVSNNRPVARFRPSRRSSEMSRNGYRLDASRFAATQRTKAMGVPIRIVSPDGFTPVVCDQFVINVTPNTA